MSEFVMMPKADYEAACNSIRAKTGKTELIKSGAMSTEIDSITGGGSSDDVRYVTFMSYDGTEEHGRLPVAVGYDCPNPKFTITRESTAQHDFVHDAWATEPNGATDANALKAVTEDRTVYATFTAVLRYYTITFYDSDGTTVLTTQSVAYGSTPSYTPTKDGYDFDGWEPALAAVTGEASYYAQWKAKAAFGTATWAEISAITTAGTSADTFAVGDKRDEVLTYADGSTENIELIIAHIRTDGSMVLALNHALATKRQMNSNVVNSDSNYFNQPLYSYLTGTVYPALSEEMRAVVRSLTPNYETTPYNIFLPTATNCGTTDASDFNKCIGDIQLDLFSTSANRVRNLGKAGTTATEYWLGTRYANGSYWYFKFIKTNGSVGASSGAAAGLTNTKGVVFLIVV